MPKEVSLTTPLKTEDVADLRVGDVVYLSGQIFTARDMAHIRIMELLSGGGELPEDFNGAALYHAGPVMIKEGDAWRNVVIGPTTSMRMEPFSEAVLGRLGVRALIGKGGMGEGTRAALRKHGCVYLAAPPGCAAVQAEAVREVHRVHWLEMGMPEAIWVMTVEKWGPLVVGMDSVGGSVFKDVKESALALIPALIGKKKS
ncbi:MAG: FumA C-terminus/TtdB family hydratase beta subunit [Planctomycetota bacterium]|jgi:fumarate hydratase subunit beta/L(+)-tartrate dehydratase beta subunit